MFMPTAPEQGGEHDQQRRSVMPGKIVHIALKVNDLEAATRFYEVGFGFRQVTTHRGKNSAHISRS
jgi:catechol-2,3-dioxygenase